MTDRELFCAVLSNGPLMRVDAATVLCGEDCEPRVKTAAGLMLQNGASLVVLSGGRHEPPRHVSASVAHPILLGEGVSPGRVILEPDSQNTAEQAANVLDLATKHGWRKIALIASPYHQYRAYLTFLRQLLTRHIERAVYLVNLPAAHVTWWGCPDGCDRTRLDLLQTEWNKIADYQRMGDVAGYSEGLAYLQMWEEGAP